MSELCNVPNVTPKRILLKQATTHLALNDINVNVVAFILQDEKRKPLLS
jgi:hypothetical protein